MHAVTFHVYTMQNSKPVRARLSGSHTPVGVKMRTPKKFKVRVVVETPSCNVAISFGSPDSPQKPQESTPQTPDAPLQEAATNIVLNIVPKSRLGPPLRVPVGATGGAATGRPAAGNSKEFSSAGNSKECATSVGTSGNKKPQKAQLGPPRRVATSQPTRPAPRAAAGVAPRAAPRAAAGVAPRVAAGVAPRAAAGVAPRVAPGYVLKKSPRREPASPLRNIGLHYVYFYV